MRCSLVDTGPLLATLDERDALHAVALHMLDKVPRPRKISPPIVTEAIHLFRKPALLERLLAAVQQEVFVLGSPGDWPATAARAFVWMGKYAAHAPDFADAYLVAWHEEESGSQIWTFDREFRTTWRTSKGKSIRLVAEK